MACDCGKATAPAPNEPMVAVDLTSTEPNGVNGTNGVHVNGSEKRQTATHNIRPPPNPAASQLNPYAPRYADFLSNVSNFNIIESTLRGKHLPLAASLKIAILTR